MVTTLSLACGAVLISVVAMFLFILAAAEWKHDWRASLMDFALACALTAGLTLIGVNLP